MFWHPFFTTPIVALRWQVNNAEIVQDCYKVVHGTKIKWIECAKLPTVHVGGEFFLATKIRVTKVGNMVH